jgi:autotransporter adhesin
MHACASKIRAKKLRGHRLIGIAGIFYSAFNLFPQTAFAVDQQYAAPNVNQPSCLAAGIYVTGGVPTGNQTAVGCSAYSLGAYSTAVGANAKASGDSNTAIGGDAFATAVDLSPHTVYQATAVGAKAQSTGYTATSLGYSSNAAGNGSMSIGANSDATFYGSTALGTGAQAVAHQSTAIGLSANANGSNSTAVGANSTTAGFENSVALGANAANTQANQIMLGTASTTYSAPGITSTASRAAQRGQTQFVTTDANGNLANSSYGPQDIARLQNDISGVQNSINVLGIGLANTNQRLNGLEKKALQGVAIAGAMVAAPMPSAPGKTRIKMNNSYYRGYAATSISVAHRLPVNIPAAITAGVSVGYRNSAMASGGLEVEF